MTTRMDLKGRSILHCIIASLPSRAFFLFAKKVVANGRVSWHLQYRVRVLKSNNI